jgi:glycogen debranching enzyme
VPSIASNAGQCLATGIIADDNVQRMVRRLFQPDMFSGWGIRTLSSAHPAYDPLSYHLGSVWPVENGTIVFGLRRYGLDDRALELAGALYDLSNLFEGFRVPECVGGYAREEFPHPGAYPQANAPQAWNQSVAGIVLQSMLGMFPIATAHTLLLDPVLPAWLPVLELRGLRVGSARVTIRFERKGSGQTDYDVLEQSGTLRVIRQPPIDALSAGWLDRIGALLKSALA